jgi:hypothetical protein
MELVTVILAIMAVFALQYFRKRRKKSSKKNFKNTDEFVQWLASEAIKDARRQNHVELDYSVESIRRVDDVLASLHNQYLKNAPSVSLNGQASSYGAYVGEVIRRSEPGAKWAIDDPVGGEKSYPIIWGGGHSYPMAWCYRRIVNGPEDNVWVKYQALKARGPNPPALQTQ